MGMKTIEVFKHKKAIRREIPPKCYLNLHENYKRSSERNPDICIASCSQKDIPIAFSFMSLFSCTVQSVENKPQK